MRCSHCKLPVVNIGGALVVMDTGTTADGLSYCPPDPDHQGEVGAHLPTLCAHHDSEVREWQGKSCGEHGWGPGHRIPVGVTMALVDEQVKSIKTWCEAGRGCSDTPKPARCMSRDKHPGVRVMV